MQRVNWRSKTDMSLFVGLFKSKSQHSNTLFNLWNKSLTTASERHAQKLSAPVNVDVLGMSFDPPSVFSALKWLLSDLAIILRRFGAASTAQTADLSDPPPRKTRRIPLVSDTSSFSFRTCNRSVVTLSILSFDLILSYLMMILRRFGVRGPDGWFDELASLRRSQPRWMIDWTLLHAERGGIRLVNNTGSSSFGNSSLSSCSFSSFCNSPGKEPGVLFGMHCRPKTEQGYLYSDNCQCIWF